MSKGDYTSKIYSKTLGFVKYFPAISRQNGRNGPSHTDPLRPPP